MRMSTSVALVLIMLCTGCSGGAGGSDVVKRTEEPVELTLWSIQDWGIESVIDQYKAEHTNVQITVMPNMLTDINSLQTTLEAAEPEADVIFLPDFILKQLDLSKDYFHDLNAYGAADLKEQYLESVWKNGASADQKVQFGIPFSVYPYAMAYRSDYFDKSGLPTDPEQVYKQMQTWDDFLRAGEQIRQHTGKDLVANIADIFSMRSLQSELLYYDPKAKKLVVDSNPSIKQAWDYAIRASELELSANAYQGSSLFGDALTNGDFAVMFLNSADLNRLKTDLPDQSGKWKITFIPGDSGVVMGTFLTAPRNGKHPKESFELIKWLTSADTQKDILQKMNLIPSTPEAYNDEAMLERMDEYYQVPYFKIMTEAAKMKSYTPYAGSEAVPIDILINNALRGIEDGSLKPNAAWQQLIEDVRTEVKPAGQ